MYQDPRLLWGTGPGRCFVYYSAMPVKCNHVSYYAAIIFVISMARLLRRYLHVKHPGASMTSIRAHSGEQET